MAKLRSVNTHFWDDSYIIELNPIEKLLFLYLLTNPLANIGGAYEITVRRMEFDTGIGREMILTALKRFESDDKIFYRDDWVFIKNFIKNQSLNPKIIKGIQENIKVSPMWIQDRLSKAINSLSKPIKAYDNLNLNLNSNINSNSNGGSPDSAAFSPNSSFESEQENYLTAVKKIYGTNALNQEPRWLKTIEQSITAEISLTAFTIELKKLLTDNTRKYPITPENILTAAIENRARAKPKETYKATVIGNRNAEMEARGLPKMGVKAGV